MAQGGRRDVKAGAKIAVAAALLILLVSAVQLLLGSPIAFFGSTVVSTAYVILVYLPVFAACVLAYRRLKRL